MRSRGPRRSRAIFSCDDRAIPRSFPDPRRLDHAECSHQYHCRQNAVRIARAPAHSATPQSVALQTPTFCVQGHYIRFSAARNVIRAVIGLFVRPSGRPSRTHALTGEDSHHARASVNGGAPDATGGHWDPAAVTELDPELTKLQGSSACGWGASKPL